MSSPQDLVSVYGATRRTNVPNSTLHWWIEQRRISQYGRGGVGGRRTVLVSLGEIREAARWKANAVSARQAGELLGMDKTRVAKLCADGELPHRRYGRTLEIERRAVERLVAVRAELEEEWVSFKEIARTTVLPWWVLRKWEKTGRLKTRRGDRSARLVRRSDLERVLEDALANPELCPECDEPVEEAGRTWHRECAGPAASRSFWNAGPRKRRERRQEAIARSRQWWNSPAGHRQREKLRSTRRHVELVCHVCGHQKVSRKLSAAAKAAADDRRTVCESCHLPWISALLRGRRAVQALVDPTNPYSTASHNAFRLVHDVGVDFETKMFAEWPARAERPRKLALDIAIEVLHQEHYTDKSIRLLIDDVLGGKRGDRFVEIRRYRAKIRRRDHRQAA